ncbi:FAD-dependent oxidoreductase [Kroppenstedtia pulmonis]|uniref:FAD-dependent oxidoreductase n=1 Tax=Kroppenstedtia pulmonis TaxID=1380685 RepID=A0A7D4BHU3_9BACL|nr:FAD-dependent monooxygenase [Kroppenstedtia pulmonis]QKG84875.1 FAD-dependent oxidoreductase [Kroppenstedtia pulmonis]
MKTLECDAVVVGAGPGGVVMSYLLARSGVQTILVERHISLDREFRGYFFQPLTVQLFEEMGLLPGVLKLPHRKETSFRFYDRDKLLFSVNMRGGGYGLNLPQPPLLQFFIDESSAYPGFNYFGGTQAVGLLKEKGKVAGIQVNDVQGEEWQIRSRLVIGADGRHSAVRRLADIKLLEAQSQFDFIWFTIPSPGKQEAPKVQVEDQGILIYVPMYPNRVQLGWVIPKRTYPAVKKRGIESFREEITAVAPDLKPILSQHLTGFHQCSVLDIVSNQAMEWVRDGLVLIGDAAHTSSPFSGQGNSLAIQDAVAAHPIVMEALKQSETVLPQSLLAPYESLRRPAVTRIQRLQANQSRLLAMNHPVLIHFRQRILPWISRTPLFRRMERMITQGVHPLQVETSYFTDH